MKVAFTAAVAAVLTLSGQSLEVGAAGPTGPGTPADLSGATVEPVARAWPDASWSDVDALVSYRVTSVSRAGVRRTDEWDERLVRRGRSLWVERVLPSSTSRAPDGHGHEHLDAERAARWLEVTPQGETIYRLVDHDARVVVTVPRAEYATVGFDGRIDALASLVPPATIASMRPDGPEGKGLDGPEGKGLRWYVGKAAGWTHRILWSAPSRLALVIESATDDGRTSRSVRVESKPGGATAPWNGMDGYEARRYDEYMD